MKRLSLHNRVEVLPALHGQSSQSARPQTVTPVEKSARAGARLTFDQRASRARRFPLEQSLARTPEAPRLGRYLDVEA